MQNQLRIIYEEPLPENASRPFVLLKTIYNLCSNTTANENDGVKNANALFKELGGWPLLDGPKWNETAFEWTKMVYKLRKSGGGFGYFISVGVLTHPPNQTRRYICLDETPLKIRQNLSNGFNDTMVRAWYAYIVDIALMYGAKNASAVKELKDVIDFKMKLANILQETKNITKLSNFTTIKELQEEFPKFNWLDYIQNIMDLPDANITENEEIIVRAPHYIKDLLILLQHTPKRVQANYIFIEYADNLIPYLTETLKIRRALFYKLIDVDYIPKPVSAECRMISYLSVGLQVDYLYVTRYFNKTVKEQAEQLVMDIRTEFVEILKKVDWLDNETRAHAIEKVLAIKQYIAYPTELLDPENVDAYYDKLVLNSTNYLMAILSVNKFLQHLDYSRLRQPRNKTNWLLHTTPLTVNAFYSTSENSINFPAGILQGVFYSKDRPNYMNYGVMGFIIGHEITHGFDNRGRLIDKDGNVNNWWSEKTKKLFAIKAQCFIDQYNNYTALNISINGASTQGENIADNGAVKESYYAYNRWVKKNGPEPLLPGLQYNPKQLFWISSAQLWCSKYDTTFLQRMLTKDPHAPAEFRVIGAFSNSEDFNKDFKCSINSPMNRNNKCSIW
ncbi:hypothetical protein RN001_007571 [Aquatica leii]|uniref:Uncharacterized protein n=1 Tax=Aquatica leii TaxID=1421715 RepID=A0AAN7Q4F2_9COLE|nr:hypothetical protein RN001_007571 [Aquatica leii]